MPRVLIFHIFVISLHAFGTNIGVPQTVNTPG